jgi:hypothetical protein
VHVGVGDELWGEEFDDAVHLVEDLLEPQLVHLVDRDEQQLLVGLVPELRALRGLRRQQLVELQVVVVV